MTKGTKSTPVCGIDRPPLSTPSPGARFADGMLVEDQLCAVLSVEEAYQVKHVPCQSRSDANRPLGDEWRQKICQWSFRVIDHFRQDREVVATALNLFDRFLVCNHKSNNALLESSSSASSKINNSATSSNKSKSALIKRHRHSTRPKQLVCACPSCAQNIDSRTYQLAAMTSLYIAIKCNPDNTTTEDGMRRKRCFKLSSFVELSRGQFKAEDICEMEGKILKTLNWRVNPPTPMALVAYLLCLMPPHKDVPQEAKPTYDLVLHVLQELSRYITELSVCLGGICTSCPASYIAYAAIQVSMDLLTLKTLPNDVRDIFNANVTMISLQSGGTLLLSHKQTIQKLKHCLSKSLLPELLLDEYDDITSTTVAEGSASSSTASCHPIIIARDYGLLNLNKIPLSSTHSTTNSSSSTSSTTDKRSESYQHSPTGVAEFRG